MYITLRKKLTVLNTGGTSGGAVYDISAEGLVVAEAGMKAPIDYLEAQVSRDFIVQHRPICCKQSSEITAEDREAIRQGIIDADGHEILVLHGTKTMAETHSFLCRQEVLMRHLKEERKKVALVGSRMPMFLTASDLPWTLATAVAYVRYAPPSIVAVVHGKVFDEGTYRMGGDGFMQEHG